MDHNNQYTTISTNFSEKAFDAILNNIKIENNSLFNDESSDLEDSASIAYMPVDIKDKKQDEICELASASYEKDVNVSESNSQELTDTELVDGKIVSMNTSSPSTALPITQISSKSTPHICLKHCFRCNRVFRVLDHPYHISNLQNIDKQNEFLKIEPSLCIDSCLCDFCWKFLKKTYVSNNPKQESFSEKRTKRVERFVSKKGLKYKTRRPRICSIHFCSKSYCHKMSVNECDNIKKILSTVESSRLDCVQSSKQTSDFLAFPFYLCKDHNDLITLMSSCQICSCKLNEPFNTADWSMYKTWNRVLIENNLPLTLQRGMFICMSCKEHISKPNPGFPTNDLPLFREYITTSNAIRLKLYGESQDILFNIRQGSTYVTSPPIVVSKIKEDKKRTKVKFSHPLITRTFHYEVDFDENDIKSITSTALLNVAEQNLVTPKLEPKDEGLDFVQLEGENLKTFTTNKPTDQLCNFYTDSTPNTSGIEMTNSLNENVDYIPENILSEQNSLSNLTDNVSNNFFYSATNHGLRHDNNKDLLQFHSDQYPGIADDNSLQNLCKVGNVEIAINESEIINSCQAVNGRNEIKNNQWKLNSHDIICNVAQDNSCVAAVEPSNVILNPVSIKRKPNNVICNTVLNKNAKKPRVNEKYSFCENNSTDNNTYILYRNKNTVHRNKNSPSTLNMISNCKNKYVLNSDFIGVQDPSNDVDEKSLKQHTSCSPKNIKLSTNVPSIHTKKAYSLDPSCASPPQLKKSLKKNPYFFNKEKYSRKGVKNVLLDKDISDSESIPETITLSEHGSLSDSEIKISDSEEFSESDEEDIKPDIKENDFIIVDSDYNFDSDSEYKMQFGAKRESAHEELRLTVTDTGKVFNDKKSTSFKVFDKTSKRKVLLNDVKIFKTKFIYENKNKKYLCLYKDEIKASGEQLSTCTIIYDDFDDSNNKNITTYKVNIETGLSCIILLDEEKIEIMHESKNKNKPSKILFSKEIETSGNKDSSMCIIILDNEKEHCNKQLSTYKIAFNTPEPICKILLNGNKIYGVSLDGRKKYIVSYIEIGSSGDDTQSRCLNIPHDEDINKKSVNNFFGNDSDNLEIYNKKVSDIIIMPNDMITVDDSHGDNELDKVQEYFKDTFSEIQRYFETSTSQSHKELYSKIGNGTDMLLYLMENLRMLYNGELVISETANKFSKKYLKEQKKTLFNFFGDPNDNINASKPFIHPSSHLHQYSKRLSADNHLQSEMTTSSSLTKSNSIASKVQIPVSKYTSSNLEYMVLPNSLKKKW